ncbi:MAG: M23 family metallopeptidase [Spirochaetia bacterium]|nr:M23 family metallopeptidase [Spirochaetia bacterium]
MPTHAGICKIHPERRERRRYIIKQRSFLALVCFAAVWMAAFAVAAVGMGSSALSPVVGDNGQTLYRSGAPELRSGSGAPDLRGPSLLLAALEPEALAGLSRVAAAERASAWLAAADPRSSSSLRSLTLAILPEQRWFQARLIMERDDEGLEDDAVTGGAFGDAYAAILALVPSSRVSREALESVLDTLWAERVAADDLPTGPVPPLARADRWMPTKSSLAVSHRFALDVFFTRLKRSGAAEIGPPVTSISSGIVVSAADDWRGGDKPETYKSGGLSPRAGNGVIVYSPAHRRYYVYFHLHDVAVRRGDVIPAGQLLGHGGNTGTNARKKGHGEHLHIEIHESGGVVWTGYKIRDFLIGLK